MLSNSCLSNIGTIRNTRIYNTINHIKRNDNTFIAKAEQSAMAIFDPLYDYKAELIETYKTVLQEIGVSYPLYMARHNINKGDN